MLSRLHLPTMNFVSRVVVVVVSAVVETVEVAVVLGVVALERS